MTKLAQNFGGKSRMSYAIRGRSATGRRGATLTYLELATITEKLKANRLETRRLILLGLLDDTKPELRSCFIGILEQAIKLAERLEVPIGPFNFSGDELPLPELP